MRSPKPRTPSWDNRSAFRMSPYPRSPASAISSSTSSSALTGSTRRQGTTSETSQTSFAKGKGKSTLAQMKTDLDERLGSLNSSSTDQQYRMGVLKNERKSLKLQAHMRDKEIAHLQAEGAQERQEAEKIHHMMEQKKLEIDLLKEEGEILHLKVELAKLQASQTVSSSHPPHFCN